MTHLDTTNNDQALVVRLGVSRLTIDVADRVFDEVRKAVDPARNLVVDMSNIDFMDSSAIGALTLLARQLEAAGTALRVSGLKPYLLETLKMMRLERLMDFSERPECPSTVPKESPPEPFNAMGDDEQRLSMAIESRLCDVSPVGACIRALCLEAGLEDMAAYQVQTCTVEAVNNAIIHAYDREPDHQIEIRWSLSESSLMVQVSDAGRTMTHMPPAIEPDPLAESGRGWWIMRQWMDSADYGTANGRNTVTLRKARIV